MAMISAAIITFNEERNIGRCIDSLQGVADEIIVVDSYSTDDTEAICKERGVTFVQHKFEGHIEQKNYAVTQTNYEYILSLDADEALSDTLKASILHEKNTMQQDVYAMNRLTNYCGQWIKHGGWYPDTKIRLFKKGSGTWGGVNPHDKILVQPGSHMGKLKGDLLHFSFYTVAQHKEQARKFASIAAHAMHKQGRKAGWWSIFIHPPAKFIRNYFLKAGFLDGYNGLRICLISSLTTYRKYKMLYALSKEA
ncbi:MAG: glycosyltransferase family 2 protein [Flavobacteriales bacterium]|nr:glycosyltransferase family 2 protein [Flavobacteriales bacterium]